MQSVRISNTVSSRSQMSTTQNHHSRYENLVTYSAGAGFVVGAVAALGVTGKFAYDHNMTYTDGPLDKLVIGVVTIVGGTLGGAVFAGVAAVVGSPVAMYDYFRPVEVQTHYVALESDLEAPQTFDVPVEQTTSLNQQIVHSLTESKQAEVPRILL